MKVTIERLVINEFKGHRRLEITGSNLVKIDGDNGKGKSTIADSISWLFYGTDAMGKTLDPLPTTYLGAETYIEALIHLDQKPVLFRRTLSGGKTSYHLNEDPIKAKQFDEHVKNIVPRELFLSQFNPMFFTAQHWQEQRKQLTQYVQEPTNGEVLDKLSSVEKEMLEAELKQRELDKIEEKARETVKKSEAEGTALRSRIRTLQEQGEADKATIESCPIAFNQIDDRIAEIREELTQMTSSGIKERRAALKREIERRMNDGRRLKSEADHLAVQPAPDTCPTCKQGLPHSHIENVMTAQQIKINEKKSAMQNLKMEIQKLNAELDLLLEGEAVFDPKPLLDEMAMLERVKAAASRIAEMNEKVSAAEADLTQQTKAFGRANYMISCVKNFRAKRAELMVEKISALFTTVTVRLFDYVASKDNYNPAFEIERNGVPFRLLSLSEKMKAGLEVATALMKLSGSHYPVFIDNAESIVELPQVPSQVFISRVVPGPLKIESDGKQEAKAS
ncbi:ATP-binding protein [Brevibacillus choshinensis]|uniref:Rad50/SbcC-type AAA domain-containing protein n=1 Tax=Brevibacillus choshinensis TaxID=54911 RepID=A0ABX7FQX8_BRECH|nr:ATP-binding protein [Brevibacillus choshinensis]QRG68567.1 hypothetical protein JNE38_05280 [Brevibacillus choshinensis]